MRSGVTKSATRLGTAAVAALLEMGLLLTFTSLGRDLIRTESLVK